MAHQLTMEGALWRREQRQDDVNEPPQPGPAQNQAQPQRREVIPAFIHPAQQEILQKINQKDLVGTIAVIRELERKNAPNPAMSRILRGSDECTQQMMYLLAQPSRAVMNAVLDNTLPQQVMQGRLLVRKPGERRTRTKHEPVAYLNYLADEHGMGLTPDDFEMLLEAFAVATDVEDDIGQFEHLGSGSELGLAEVLNRHWRKRHNVRNEDRLWDRLKNPETLTENAEKIIKYSRETVLPEARQQNRQHIMFKAEAGWSMEGYARCEQHDQLRVGSSPDAFVIAQLLVQLLFPRKKFRLHQFYLFDIMIKQQAAIGECIASQMAGAYCSYGGFNSWQAGISVTKAWGITNYEWLAIQEEAFEHRYSRYVTPNFEQAKELYTSWIDNIEVSPFGRHVLDKC